MAVPQGTIVFGEPVHEIIDGNKSVTISWSGVTGATEYYVEYGTNTVTSFNMTTTDNFLQIVPYTQEYSVRRIRVTPRNADGSGTQSATHIYYTKDWVNPVMNSLTVLSTTSDSITAQGSATDPRPAVGNASGIQCYRFWITYDAGVNWHMAKELAPGLNTYTYMNGVDGVVLLPQTTYTIRVDARDVYNWTPTTISTTATTLQLIKEPLAGMMKSRSKINPASLTIISRPIGTPVISKLEYTTLDGELAALLEWTGVTNANRFIVKYGVTLEKTIEVLTYTATVKVPEFSNVQYQIAPYFDLNIGIKSAITESLTPDITKPAVSAVNLGATTALSMTVQAFANDVAPPSGNSSGIASYQFYISYNAGGTFELVKTVSSTAISNSYTYQSGIDGVVLQPSTTYTIGVTATDAQGNVSTAFTRTAQTGAPIVRTLAGVINSRSKLSASIRVIYLRNIIGEIAAKSKIAKAEITVRPPVKFAGVIKARSNVGAFLSVIYVHKLNGKIVVKSEIAKAPIIIKPPITFAGRISSKSRLSATPFVAQGFIGVIAVKSTINGYVIRNTQLSGVLAARSTIQAKEMDVIRGYHLITRIVPITTTIKKTADIGGDNR